MNNFFSRKRKENAFLFLDDSNRILLIISIALVNLLRATILFLDKFEKVTPSVIIYLYIN